MNASWAFKTMAAKAGGSLMTLALLTTALVAAPAGAAIARSAWTDVGPPAAATGYPSSQLASVSCPSKSICFAVGGYKDSDSQYRAMAAKQQDGSWFQAVHIVEPKDAATAPSAALNGIACTSTSNCWAVGTYTDSSQLQQSMATHFNGSTWSRAKKITPPSDSSGTTTLSAISCPTSTTCVAVGNYLEQFHGAVAMSTSLSGGQWSTEAAAKLPRDATDVAPSKFTSVSCTSATSCWAVGSYLNSRPSVAPVAAQWSSGKMKRGIETAYPQDANLTSVPAVFTSIGCSGSAGCLAVGTYQDGPGTHEGFAVVLHGDTWGQSAKKLLVPFDAASDPYISSVTVACADVFECIVSNNYSGGAAARVSLTGFSPGRWGAPTGFDSDTSFATEIEGVACHRASICTAVGSDVAFPFASKATSTTITK